MIAYLARSRASGRVLARRQLGLLPTKPTSHTCRTLHRPTRDREVVGFLATRFEHLAGLEISGFVVLEPVGRDLLATAVALVRRLPDGRSVVKSNAA